jgi:transcriptional regulator of met regulon
MSKKTRTELEILSHAYSKQPTPENADLLIKTLQDALKSREDSIAELEKGVRLLEIFLSEKTDCVEKKP